MKLKEGVSFDKATEMLVKVWDVAGQEDRDWEMRAGEKVFTLMEKYWRGEGNDVWDYSVCWLFCYGDSGKNYEEFEPRIPRLWNELFDIPYDRFVEFQTAADGGVIASALGRYLHGRREKFRDEMEAFTFADEGTFAHSLLPMLHAGSKP